MQTQNKSISPWLNTQFAAHQWCSSVSTAIPPEKSEWTPPLKRLLFTFHQPPSEIFSVFSSLQASRYLSYLVYPLCISGAVFSLFYLRQRRWDSGLTRWLSGFTLMASAHPDQCKAAKCLFFPFTVIIRGWSTLWWLVSSCACTPSAETDCVCDVFPWPTSDCSPPLRSLRLWLPFNGASAICQLQGQSCVAMGIFLTV